MSGTIVVLAGVNGGGKSSVAGEALRRSGSTYYNPDEATERYNGWNTSRENLIRRLPHLAELSLWDNSASVALHEGERPRALKILAMRGGRIVFLCPLKSSCVP